MTDFNFGTRLDNLGGYGLPKIMEQCGGPEQFWKMIDQAYAKKYEGILIASAVTNLIIASITLVAACKLKKQYKQIKQLETQTV